MYKIEKLYFAFQLAEVGGLFTMVGALIAMMIGFSISVSTFPLEQARVILGAEIIKQAWGAFLIGITFFVIGKVCQ